MEKKTMNRGFIIERSSFSKYRRKHTPSIIGNDDGRGGKGTHTPSIKRTIHNDTR